VHGWWQVAVRTGAKFWIPTHDEHLKYGGIKGYLQTKHKKGFEDVVRMVGQDGWSGWTGGGAGNCLSGGGKWRRVCACFVSMDRGTAGRCHEESEFVY